MRQLIPTPARRTLKNIRDEWRVQRQRHLDSFIFIHINKNAGSSIEKALHLRFEHFTAEEKKWEMGATRWASRFKFTFVRNPWDRVVSQYHHRQKMKQLGFRGEAIEFNEWVRRAYGEHDYSLVNQPKFFMPQLFWISDDDRRIRVDFVGRYERLSEDFAKVCEKIGKDVELPHVKKTARRKHYTEYYNDTTREIIATHFKPDIDAFGYSYGNE